MSKESAEKCESAFKADPTKRKVDTEETRNSVGNGPRKDENRADPMDKEGDEGEEDGGGVPQPKRLRRLAKVAATEDRWDRHEVKHISRSSLCTGRPCEGLIAAPRFVYRSAGA